MPTSFSLTHMGNRFVPIADYKNFTDKNWIIFSYNTYNLGDYVQTIVVKNVLSKLYPNYNEKVFNRDSLFQFIARHKDKYLALMQGWFSHTNDFLPNGVSMAPVFIGTHFSNVFARKYLKEVFDKFPKYKENEFGCRDINTQEWLKSQGCENTYFSRCLTLTFDKIYKSSNQEYIYCVNLEKEFVNKLKDKYPNLKFKEINQQMVRSPHDYESKLKLTNDLLQDYVDNAKVVITSAIHCACPCIAMGIPTIVIKPRIFLQDFLDRTTILDGISPLIFPKDLDNINLETYAFVPDIEELKSLLLTNVKLSVNKILQQEYDSKLLEDTRIKIREFKSKNYNENPICI